MANQNHLDILKQGVQAWNRWRRDDPLPPFRPLVAAILFGSGPDLSGADLSAANLEGIDFTDTNLRETRLSNAHLKGARFVQADLSRADLGSADLAGATLAVTDLTGADLSGANLVGADLTGATLSGADLSGANLAGARLTSAWFDQTTRLDEARLGDEQQGGVWLGQVRWNTVRLSGIDWAALQVLGEEREARQARTSDGSEKPVDQRLSEYERAIQAYAHLARALHEQGLEREAERFASHRQVLQRASDYRALLRQRASHRRKSWLRACLVPLGAYLGLLLGPTLLAVGVGFLGVTLILGLVLIVVGLILFVLALLLLILCSLRSPASRSSQSGYQ